MDVRTLKLKYIVPDLSNNGVNVSHATLSRAYNKQIVISESSIKNACNDTKVNYFESLI